MPTSVHYQRGFSSAAVSVAVAAAVSVADGDGDDDDDDGQGDGDDDAAASCCCWLLSARGCALPGAFLLNLSPPCFNAWNAQVTRKLHFPAPLR